MPGFNVHTRSQTLSVCLLNCSPQTQELHEPRSSQILRNLRDSDLFSAAFFIPLPCVDTGLLTSYFKVMREILCTVLVGTP